MRTGRVKGFTFVEMIVVIVITASLGVAIYATFSQGVRLWTRTSGDRGEWKVDLWGERLIEGLRNAFRDPQWAMKGTSTEIFFATLEQEKGRAFVQPVPAYFHYIFDPKAGAAVSRRYAFEEIFTAAQEPPRASDSVLPKVISFGLEYYGYDARAKDYRWVSQWNKDCFPETVKITIETRSMNHYKWARMVPVPAGGACPE
jgi:prepilin-type N-terminal cleavage/methylation domain-containing protein